MLDEQWHATGMINVRMAQDDSIDLVGADRQRLEIQVVVFPLTLKLAAVEQQRTAANAHEMARERCRVGKP